MLFSHFTLKEAWDERTGQIHSNGVVFCWYFLPESNDNVFIDVYVTQTLTAIFSGQKKKKPDYKVQWMGKAGKKVKI